MREDQRVQRLLAETIALTQFNFLPFTPMMEQVFHFRRFLETDRLDIMLEDNMAFVAIDNTLCRN